jgi:hypothetical protein
LLIALVTKRHAKDELMNCTMKLYLSSLRELKTAPSVFYLFRKLFLTGYNLAWFAVGR